MLSASNFNIFMGKMENPPEPGLFQQRKGVMKEQARTDKTDKLAALLKGRSSVIFDFDNVIVDSEPYHFEAYSRVFAEEGHRLDREEYWMEWTFRGGGAEGEISRHGLDLDPDFIRSKKDPVYSEFCDGGAIRVNRPSLKIIEALRDMGYILAIASGSYTRDIISILRAGAMEDYFDAVIGKDQVSSTKPHPETYLAAASSLKKEPAQCLAVEDAAKGIISAHAAGMPVLAVETEITRGFDLGEADLVFSSLEELAEAVRGLSEERQDNDRR
jgi:beta-phosphoglucomutase-like phosphatase (HAD superfamily)